MRTHILLCWLGRLDLRAASGAADVGLGSVAKAVAERSYGQVALLNNWKKSTAKNYVAWLKRKTPSRTTLHHIPFSGPTNFGEIYQIS